MGKTVFETENMHSRDEIAEYLAQVSENLRAGRVTLVAGDDEFTVEPPEEATLGIEIEEEEGETSLEFEIEW